MTKSKKIVIGVVSLLILLLVGLISYREITKESTSYQEYCSYYNQHKMGTLSCYDSFKVKCETTGGQAKNTGIPCFSSCPKGVACILGHAPCQNEENSFVCECPFLQRWNDKWGCSFL